MISAAKEIEPGVRAMLVHAEGLFRLDVVFREDTLRIIVRNLFGGELSTSSPLGGYPGEHIVCGAAAAYDPSHASVEFSLGQDSDRVTVKAELATLHFHDRGTVRVSAQAIVREASHSAS